MKETKRGSVIGGILLIAGSCIGAGMLGLPILTGMVGFFPSLLMFAVACFFMTAMGLIVVEIDAWFHDRSNFITMVTDLLGPVGRVACWILYLFLFYAIITAYVAASGYHVSSFFSSTFTVGLPNWLGSLFFVVFFGWVTYLGTRSVDLLNRVLMVGKIFAFFALLFFGFSFVKADLLMQTEMKYILFPLPILIISFGYHNMIPTLSHYLGGDIKRIKQSIIGGTIFTLTVYILWQIVALGSLPIEGKGGITSSYKAGVDAAQAIKNFIHVESFGNAAQILAFFAILTSFLAQTLSLVHFLCDGMNISHRKNEPVGICILALVPPLIAAVIYPSIFYKALNFAGGICTVILFGILPLLMCWKGRYLQKIESKYTFGGGKKMLVFLFLISAFILFYQISETAGFALFPSP